VSLNSFSFKEGGRREEGEERKKERK